MQTNLTLFNVSKGWHLRQFTRSWHVLELRSFAGNTARVNPFVNPGKRAIELPSGCKDLNDVLSKAGRSPVVLSQFRQGGLGEIRTFVGDMYQKFYSQKYLCIMQYAKSVFFTVRHERGSFKLWLMRRASDELMETITEIFGESTSHPDTILKPLQNIRVTLPGNCDDAAQAMIDLLFRAYNISEHDKFILFSNPTA